MNEKAKTKKMVLGAILTALVVVLQLIASICGRFGIFSITLTLIPIVIGAATCGVGMGAWLGFVFGLVVLALDSGLFLAFNPWATILVVLAKGTLCGVAATGVFKLFEKKNIYLAVALAAIVCPVVNTGIFFAGCMLFFVPVVEKLMLEASFAGSVSQFVIFGFIGINFILELAVNIILSPVIMRILKAKKV